MREETRMKVALIALAATVFVCMPSTAEDAPRSFELVETADCPMTDFVREAGAEYLQSTESVFADVDKATVFAILRIGDEVARQTPGSLADEIHKQQTCAGGETFAEYVDYRETIWKAEQAGKEIAAVE